jgi:hypothetical protein
MSSVKRRWHHLPGCPGQPIEFPAGRYPTRTGTLAAGRIRISMDGRGDGLPRRARSGDDRASVLAGFSGRVGPLS